MKRMSDILKYTKTLFLRVVHEGEYKNGEQVSVHQYNSYWIKQIIVENIKMGNYCIGVINGDCFEVCYVGRATDQTLQERMLQHPEYEKDKYFFFAKEAKNEKEAINQECIDYHSFGGVEGFLDNIYHPAIHEGKQCPWKDCDHVGCQL